MNTTTAFQAAVAASLASPQVASASDTEPRVEQLNPDAQQDEGAPAAPLPPHVADPIPAALHEKVSRYNCCFFEWALRPTAMHFPLRRVLPFFADSTAVAEQIRNTTLTHHLLRNPGSHDFLLSVEMPIIGRYHSAGVAFIHVVAEEASAGRVGYKFATHVAFASVMDFMTFARRYELPRGERLVKISLVRQPFNAGPPPAGDVDIPSELATISPSLIRSVSEWDRLGPVVPPTDFDLIGATRPFEDPLPEIDPSLFEGECPLLSDLAPVTVAEALPEASRTWPQTTSEDTPWRTWAPVSLREHLPKPIDSTPARKASHPSLDSVPATRAERLGHASLDSAAERLRTASLDSAAATRPESTSTPKKPKRRREPTKKQAPSGTRKRRRPLAVLGNKLLPARETADARAAETLSPPRQGHAGQVFSPSSVARRRLYETVEQIHTRPPAWGLYAPPPYSDCRWEPLRSPQAAWSNDPEQPTGYLQRARDAEPRQAPLRGNVGAVLRQLAYATTGSRAVSLGLG
jgi:hypothetical protein